MDYINFNEIKSFTKEDWKNLIYFLGLEFNAAKRYEIFISLIKDPNINRTLEGIKRNEEEHIESAISLIKKFADQNAPAGFRTLLALMKINLDFEERAIKVYQGFASASSDPILKEHYNSLIKAENGHLNIFRKYIEEIEKQLLDVIFYCPVCGWDINFGKTPKEGDRSCCQRCGTHVEVYIENGDYEIRRV
ncbi:MAG: ferritin-like domain-containing protein [Proteobacteria bacterium]|nr:ferritin-like domain-containing protein [Pseudomonadota bacterium]